MIDWAETKKRFNRSDLSGRRPRVSVKCDMCGKIGSKTIGNKSLVNGNKYEWICKSCSVKKQWENGDFKNHSNNMRDRWKDDKYRMIFKSSEFRNKKREESTKIWSNDEMREKARVKSINLWKDEKYRSNRKIDKNKISNKSKELWKSKQYRDKVITATKKYFNSEEYKKRSMLSVEEVIKRSKDLHGDKYDYSLSEYDGYNKKIDIICPIHGVFSQRVINHLQGCGCPKCPKHTSLQQNEVVDFVSNFYDGEIIVGDRETIKPYEVDILIPELKICIEYNGNYWHSYGHKESKHERMKHSIKHDMCLNVGYHLVQISEHEWNHKNEIVRSKIKYLLGVSNVSIYARKCSVSNISNKDYREFMSNNHMQGHKNASVKIGLIYNDEIVAVMSFNKHPKYEWEITRFANKLDTTVVGGASRLFKHFLKQNDPDSILTYADRRYSIGSLYEKLGFSLDGITNPNYTYTDKDVVFSRQQFQKHKLKDKLDVFDPGLTEAENMFNNGYRRMWDAGHYRFLWIK